MGGPVTQRDAQVAIASAGLLASIDWVFILSTNVRLVSAFNLPLAVFAGWLLWRSLEWPLVGDATVLHFIAGQMKMGAVPYRDIVDFEMPLTYLIHAVVVAIGGMSDGAWRAFDLAATAVMSALILMLVAPAGRAVAILAVLSILVTHLLHGPLAAGQRDFLMSILALVCALMSVWAAEDQGHRSLWLLLAGAFSMTAALIKPSGILLLFLPALLVRLDWPGTIWITAGALSVGLLMFGILADWGGGGAFVTMTREVLPLYASMDTRSVATTLAAVQRIAPIAGLAVAASLSIAVPQPPYLWVMIGLAAFGVIHLLLQRMGVYHGYPLGVGFASGLAIAAALGIAIPKPPRVRAMIALSAFGLIHLLVQRKGYFYHVYPVGVGLACWGAWALAKLSTWRVLVCLILTASGVGWLAVSVPGREIYDPSLRAASAMQAALESHLPPGARVQMMDSDHGAFLAMARAGMRQATPHVQWFPLLFGKDAVRRHFLAALEADPPAAVLLTNSQWPNKAGFEAADDWPELTAFLASHYDLNSTGQEDFGATLPTWQPIKWRLSLKRAP